ncbi:MAG: type II toxin-antitoxin system Phd/YefM family antitoxin [Solirubrobacteraceae bacterium]
MPTIPQKELRNNVGDVLRRAEAGEEFTVTVSGRPVARVVPLGRRAWVPTAELTSVWATPSPVGLAADLAEFDIELRDPWA